jgi:hypothetical protein
LVHAESEDQSPVSLARTNRLILDWDDKDQDWDDIGATIAPPTRPADAFEGEARHSGIAKPAVFDRRAHERLDQCLFVIAPGTDYRPAQSQSDAADQASRPWGIHT